MSKSRKLTMEQIQEALNERFARWDEIRVNGCSDCFYTDGAHLNLIRNHILYWYGELGKLLSHSLQMRFDGQHEVEERRPVPPEMRQDFMVNPSEIHQNAEKTLSAILSSPDYIALAGLEGKVPRAEEGRLKALLQYPVSLKYFLETGQYPRLRSYQDSDYWLRVYANQRVLLEAEMVKMERSELLCPTV